MGYTMKNKARIEQLRKEVSNLMNENSAAEVLEAIIHECGNGEMEELVELMEQEVSYRGKYKMIKIETMDQEIKLEEFLNQLYPMYSDRSQATLL
jgi:transposase